MSHSVEVALFNDTVEKDVLIGDNVLILDNVPSRISDDMLMLYIDSITELDGEQNDYSIDHKNSETVITFNVALDAHIFPAGMHSI